jgi:hypothetical protein
MESNEARGARPLSPAIAATLLWCAITVAILASTLAIYYRLGPPGLKAVVQAGPISDITFTFFSVAAAWLLLGAFLSLLSCGRIHSGNVITVVCFFLVSLLYVNFVRERVNYGDIADYVRAALNLAAGTHLDARYLYPPLWATLLKPLVPLGARAIFDVCWLLNLFAVCAFFLLLQHTLKRYGFSPRLAAITTALFMIVNVAIIRTLCYVQVNLHVMNLILLSLLVYPRSAFVSAAALALAVHLKMSPIVLVIAFLMQKDWRWFAWFMLWVFLITGATIVSNGVYPYRDFILNAQRLYAGGEPFFREYSINSFIRALFQILNGNQAAVRFIVGLATMASAAATLVVVASNVRHRAFFGGTAEGEKAHNAAPGLLVLMMLLAPLIWEHHGVFLALPFLVLLKRLSSPVEWLAYGSAYAAVFLVPTFDFFPWSYARLAALFAWLWLAWSVSRRSEASKVFAKANAWLESAPVVKNETELR